MKTAPLTSRLAVIPVRAGALPTGADETVAEAAGHALLVGTGTRRAAAALEAPATELWTWEAGDFDPGAWAGRLARTELLNRAGVILLPASPDGRDLAPRLAHAAGRSLYAGVVSTTVDAVTMTRYGDRGAEDRLLQPPAVVTLVPGRRGLEARPDDYRAPEVNELALPQLEAAGVDGGLGELGPEPGRRAGVEVIGVSPPDPSTMDLAEASFIVAGGMGLGDEAAFTALSRVADGLGASLGATRVVTDAGWAPFERQIGTTGVAVDPRVYLAIGISGAVQHTSGLGDPAHIISVNLDPSCPMMSMADLAIVADGPAVVRALGKQLEASRSPAVGEEPFRPAPGEESKRG